MERTQLSAIVLDLLEKETGETYDALEDSTTLNEGLGLDSIRQRAERSADDDSE